ncbi:MULTISPECIES: hypothetical protein, partial [unclassified Halomonas]|uniref:hypothetical protein n=1 Tax=unclassified Halomonas TaxID=2609666 RepID=UPI0020A02DC7
FDNLLGEGGLVTTVLAPLTAPDGLLGGLGEADLFGGTGGLLGDTGLVGSILANVAGPQGLLSGLLDGAVIGESDATGLLDSLLGESGLVESLLGEQGLLARQLPATLDEEPAANLLASVLGGEGLMGDLFGENGLLSGGGLSGSDAVAEELDRLLSGLLGEDGALTSVLAVVSDDGGLLDSLLGEDSLVGGLIGDGGLLGSILGGLLPGSPIFGLALSDEGQDAVFSMADNGELGESVPLGGDDEGGSIASGAGIELVEELLQSPSPFEVSLQEEEIAELIDDQSEAESMPVDSALEAESDPIESSDTVVELNVSERDVLNSEFEQQQML